MSVDWQIGTGCRAIRAASAADSPADEQKRRIEIDAVLLDPRRRTGAYGNRNSGARENATVVLRSLANAQHSPADFLFSPNCMNCSLGCATRRLYARPHHKSGKGGFGRESSAFPKNRGDNNETRTLGRDGRCQPSVGAREHCVCSRQWRRHGRRRWRWFRRCVSSRVG